MSNIRTGFCAIVVFAALPLCAQQLPWPTDPDGKPYRLDYQYGARYVVNEGSFFHKGIDLNERGTSGNEDMNQPIVAAANGTIFGIGRTGEGIHWIGVDYGNSRTFTYLHIFSEKYPEITGNFGDVVPTTIRNNSLIRSYRRVVTKNDDGVEDNNLGLIIFYSGDNSTGKIIKALGISKIHTINRIQISTYVADIQDTVADTPTASTDTIVVSAGTDGVLETMPATGDEYSLDGMSIVSGADKKADTTKGYITISTTVVEGEIIAPLGKSGATNAHLHLQISHADERYINSRDPYQAFPTISQTAYNDGWDSIMQYLVHSTSTFSGVISTPTTNTLVYHTADHAKERVTASIRERPADSTFETYNGYELDRMRLFAVPKDEMATVTDYPTVIAGYRYVINQTRNVLLTGTTALANITDPFRAEFDYGGSVDPAQKDNAFPPFISNTSPYYRSDGRRTGMKPQGILLNNPVTDFVFNQWNTRIRADFSTIAYRSMDAAYPDGDYALLAVAESVDRDPEEMFVSNPVYVGIDNFRPYVEQVELKTSGENENTVYLRKWAHEGTVLKSTVASVEQPIVPGVYRVAITFSEYINDPSVWLQPGTNISTDKRDDFAAHKSILEGNISIFGGAYPHDAVARLMVKSSDTAGNSLLELLPERTTVDPALELTRNAAGAMQGVGGVDQLHSLHIEVSSPAIAWEISSLNFSAPCYEVCNTEADPVYFRKSTVTFNYSDLGAGLREITVYKEGGGVEQQMVFQNRVYEQLASFTLPDGKYKQTVRDNLGKTSTLWFTVDSVTPRLEVGGINMSRDFSNFSIYGVVQDTTSGMDSLKLSMDGTPLANINLPGGTTEQVPYSIPDLPAVTPAYYVLSSQDRALNLSPNIVAQFATYNGQVSNYLGGDEPYVVGRHITRITASGNACSSITVAASPNTFNIPINYPPTTNVITTSLPQDTDPEHPVMVYSGSEYMHGKLSVAVPHRWVYDEHGVFVGSYPICNATVETTNLASLQLGPRVSVVREGDEFTGSDVKFDYGWITMIFHNLKTLADQTPKLTTELAAAPTPLPGYVVYPPGISRGWRIKYTGVTYDNVEVAVHGLPSGLSAEARAGFKMRHYKEDGTWEDLPTSSTENSITGISPGNNLFVLLAPLSIYDKSGPVTTVETRTYETDGHIYVSSANHVALYSVDISSDSNALAGVASTYYLLAAEPTTECLGAAYNPSTAPGTCQNPLYNGPFQVAEGVRSLYYWAVDKIGNAGAAETRELRVDGTPPVSALEINGMAIAAGATVYAATTDVITLTATDTVSNDVVSGLTTTYFLVDITSDECSYMDWSGGINGMGTCENRFYTGPFTLPQGEHVIYYLSRDNAGNMEPVKTAYIVVAAIDTAPPVVTASINNQIVGDGVAAIMLSTDTITLTAIDEGSGVLGIYYTVDAAFSTTTATTYTAPFTLSTGTHTVYYSAMDNVGNTAAVKSINVAIQPPGDMMPAGYIRKIAGTGVYGYSGDGGDALAANFAGPWGLALEGNGNLLIAEAYNHKIRKVSADGKVVTVAGTGLSGFSGDGGPAALAQFNRPYDLTLDSQGNIYIADRGNNRVRKIDVATGNIGTVAQNIPYLESLAFDNLGALYASAGSRVYKILPDGQTEVVAGNGVNGFSGDGGPAVSARLNLAQGIAFDAGNNLYIADTYNQRIRRVDFLTRVITTIAGGGGLVGDEIPALQRSISPPIDVAVDTGGNILLNTGYVLFRINAVSGLISAVHGEGYKTLGSTAMPAAFTTMSGISKLCLDGAGGLYFSGNNQVAKISLPGVVIIDTGTVKLYSNNPAIVVSRLPSGNPALASALTAALQQSLLPAGTIYAIAPVNMPLSPSGSLALKYDPKVAIDTTSLAIFSYNGVSWSSAPAVSGLGNQQILPAIPYYTGNLAAGELSRTSSLIGLFMWVTDKTAPISSSSITGPVYGGTPVHVSPKTVFTIRSLDDLYKNGDKKGLGVSRQTVRIKKDNLTMREIIFNNPAPSPGQVFVSTFSLDHENSGIYTVEYYAADMSGNMESVKVTTATLDTDPPLVELALEGPVEPAGAGFNSLAGFNVRIDSTDTVSGVATVKYMVDIATETCNWALPVISTEPAGTCRNPVYAGPFTLAIGTHTIYYSAADNVGNQTPVKSVFVNVESSKYPNAAQWPYFEYLGGFGAYGMGPGYFKNLHDLNFDQNGNIWAADITNGKIEIFAPGGEYLRTFTAGLTAVNNFSVCPDGTFWALSQITNGYYLALKKFSIDGALLKEVDILGSQQFSAYPRYVVCDRENKPFVAGNTVAGANVLSFDASGNYKGKFPTNISSFQGFALDGDGNFLIGDYSTQPNLRIKKFSQAGNLLASMPLISSSVYSLSLDSYGNIYVPNYSYSSVEIYSSTGGLIRTFGDLPIGRQMMSIGQPHYVGVHPYSGRLYVGGTSDVKIYGPDHTPPQYVPGGFSLASGAVVYTTSPFIAGSADAVSLITAYEGATPVGNAQADQYGDFSFNPPGLGMGRHSLRFQSSDAAGNVSPFSPDLDLTVKAMNTVEFSTPVWGPGNSEIASFGVWDTSATVLGDFDRDGRVDVVGFSYRGKYSFYKGNGAGTFKYVYTDQIPGMNVQYSGGDDALAADFNNDGFLDVAASVYSPNYPYTGSVLLLFYGKGDGTFNVPVTIDHLISYAGIAKGDFNNDGYPDLASASGNAVNVYLGDPASLFISISTPIPAELPPSTGGGIAMSDIDGDGKTDIVFRNAVLFGDGLAGFDSKVILPYSYTHTADVKETLVSDFNQDGRKDIFLIAIQEAFSFLNWGNRTFKKVHRVSGGSEAPFYSGASADFNGDGITDIAVSPYRLQNIYVMAGYGDGTFAAPVALPTGGYAQYGHLSGTVSAEDITGDGRSDILQASSELGLAGGQTINTFFSFLNKTAAPDVIPPAAVSIAVENTEAGEVAVFWTAPGNDGNTGTAVRYDLKYKSTPILSDIDFNAAQSISNIASPRVSGSAERFTLATLAGGTGYYFALKTYDAAGNASALSNSPGIFTRYIVKTTNTIAGNPEIGMVSPVQPYITQVNTVSGSGAVAIGSAAVQSLTMASNMYEIKPEGIYEPPATLTFYYSTAALAAVGLVEADAAVYEYFSGTGWVKLEGQVLDTLNHKITVPITRIASLFGIFGVVTDRTVPVTVLSVDGVRYEAGGKTYIGAASSMTLAAYDPVVFGTSTGVAFTEFRVDADTTAPFALYTGAFILSTGSHGVEYRSRDNSGNIEAVKSINIFIDGDAPSTWYTVAGSSFAAGGIIYAAPGSTVTLISSDTAAGVTALFYTINGSTRSASSGVAEIYLSSAGTYGIGYHAEDNVANIGVENVVSVYVDTIAPVSALSLSGNRGRSGWYISAVDAGINARDAGSGIRDTFYSLDESTFTGYVSSFSILSEGKHAIKAYSSDNVSNIESVQLLAFGIDISTPVVGYLYLPVANGDAWNNTAVDVVFAGTDTISGIEYCSSSFTVSNEGIGITVSGYCADYAGWTSTASFRVNIDTTAPSSNVEIAAEHGLNGWLLSPAGITLVSTDSLSGVGGIYYSVDGSSFALYSSSFAVSGEGAHTVKYYSLDRASNKETEKEFAFKLDFNAPIAEAVLNPAANNSGWNNTAVTAVFSGTDTVSGVAYCESEKVVNVEGSSRTVTGYCADYAGWSSTAVLVVNIDTTTPNLSYLAEPAPNEAGWNNSDVALKFACADGLSGIKFCPADTLLSGEGLSISTAAVAYDYAGNFKNGLVAGINIDRTAPVSTAAVSGAYMNGWYSSTVTVILASTDTLSGVGRIMYWLEGTGGSGVESVYAEPLIIGTSGIFKLYYYAEDIAGNIEAEKTIEFKLDSSAPSVDYALVPAPDPGGWNNAAVQVVFAGTDTLSGVGMCSTETVVLEGAAQKISGWCRDVAGNIGYSTATVNLDLTKPAVSARQLPSPNESGWNNAPVEVVFTGTDTLSGLAYCESAKTISVEGSSQVVSGYCLDNAGNSSTSTIVVNLDITVPGISVSRLPLANIHGWANQDVIISYACTDALSGVAVCPAMKLFSLERADISTSAFGYDYADNMGRIDVSGISIDKTTPETRAELSGVMENGWYNTAVTLTLVSTDALSGVDKVVYRVEGADYSGTEQAYTEPVVFNGAGVFKVYYHTTDRAGNAEMEKALTFRIDRALPLISYALAPTANEQGWNNTSMQVIFGGTDTLSGIAVCSSATVTIEGVTQKIAGWCRDLAGNIGYATATVSVDLTIPLVSASQTPAANIYGWNNKSVTIGFECADAMSGIKSCPGSITYSAEGLDISTSVRAWDLAGNYRDSAVSGINIDKTPPVSAAALSGVYKNGYYNGVVAITITSTDALSGVASTFYSLDGGEFAEYQELIVVNAEGRHIVRHYAQDKAGNTEAGRTLPFNIDATAPVVSYAIMPPANFNGWNNSTAEVVFTATDSFSGVASCTPGRIVSVEGSNQLVTGSCADLAGNVAYSTAIVNMDLSVPEVSATGTPAANVYGWNNGSVTVTFNGNDTVSGIAYCTPKKVGGAEGSSQTISGYCVDYAGLSSTATYIVGIDTTAPVVGYLRTQANADGWNNTDVAVSFECWDGLAGVAGCPGVITYSAAGVNLSTSARVWDLAGNYQDIFVNSINIDKTPAISTAILSGHYRNGWYSSAVGIVLESTDTASGVKQTYYSLNGAAYAAYSAPLSVGGEGAHELRYYAVDKAGNKETAGKVEFKIDAQAPSVGYTLEPPANTAGWNNSVVSVLFTGTDDASGVEECSSGNTSAEGVGQKIAGWCRDVAGNIGYATATVSVDLTIPLVSTSQTPAANIYSWNNENVTAGFECADVMSGIKSCPGSITYSAEGIAISTTVRAWDLAGNYRDSEVSGINIDKTPPVSAAALSGVYKNGYYSGVVSVTITSTDTLSGVAWTFYSLDGGEFAEYQGPIGVSAEGRHVVRYYAQDKAGNTEAGRTLPFNIDATAPVVSYAIMPPANFNGWNNSTAEVVFTATDSFSGVASCTPGRLVSVEGSNQLVAGSCADLAGNVAYSTAIVNLDLSDPEVSAVKTPVANADGWNNTDVAVSFECSDGLAGVAGCPGVITYSAAGVNLSTSARVWDLAGNYQDIFVNSINIDKTPAISTAILSGHYRNGWYSSAVGIVLESTDTASGVKQTYYSLNGAAYAAYSAPLSVGGEGAHELRYYAVDKAGNKEAEKPIEFNLDTTVPLVSYTLIPAPNLSGWNSAAVQIVFAGTDTVSGVELCSSETIVIEGAAQKIAGWCRDAAGNTGYSTATINTDFTRPVTLASQVPVPNSNGWNKEPVTVNFAGSDALSGTAYCTPEKLISTEAAEQEVTGYCTDYAGNSSTATLTLNIDRTPPVIAISSPAAGQTFVATRGKVHIGFTVKDNLDPAPAFEAFLTQVEDKGSPKGNRPAIIAVVNGQSIEPLDMDDGIWRLTVSATDSADNTNSLSGGTFEVVHDVLAPRTGQAVAGGASLLAGGVTYITGDTALQLASADDLVLVEDGIGLGVKNQAVRLKAGGLTVKELIFTNPEPKQGVVFTSTFTVSTLDLADGLYNLSYRAEDVLGNIEAEKTLTIGLDNTAPETAAVLAGTLGDNGWHVSAVTVTLAANDALSGVEGIYYQAEFKGQKSELKNYIDPVVVNEEGLYKVYFYAKDKLGNTEVEKTIAFKIDLTDPLISAERSPLANEYGWNNTAVTASYICTDGLSGIKFCPPATTLDGEGLNQGTSGEALDFAGNGSSASVSGINIDKTAPISAYRPEGMVYPAETGKTYLNLATSISLSAADPVSGGAASGIDVVEYNIDSAPFMVYTSSFGLSEGIRTVHYRSRDKAGNMETAKSAELHIDGTSPLTLLNISALLYSVDGVRYITPESVLGFAATDPLINDTASGVLITKYRIDGGNWQVYVDSFSITAEGLHIIEYYSLDRVQNAEAMKTVKLAVDNTPPATVISYGEPKAETFGLPLITPATRITLSAGDPVINGAASGLNSIFYEIENTQTGTLTPVTAYISPFTIPEQGTFIIRYWSKDNTGNTDAAKEKIVAVTTWREDGLAAVSGLEMSGTADIAGAVRSNAIVSLGGNARILGDVTASTITVSGKAQITGRQVSGAAPVNPAPVNLAGIIQSAIAVNNNALVSTYLVDGKLVIGSKAAITLSTGTYYFKGIELSGGSSITIAGKVDILVEGGISINGGSSLNASGAASLLSIVVSTSSELKFNGGAALAACVYAPYSNMKLAGNALLGGHYFVKTAAVSGTGNILQSGEALPVAAAPTGGGIKTKAAAMSAGSFGVLAGPDPAFRLGEVYVFPNPAKGSETPVFHIETGIADSVKITIYTVSGRAAHEYTLTGLPAELDDGNGLSYAYEYAWRGHIPSGVYLYYIETQKAGQKLKKTGKFAVIR